MGHGARFAAAAVATAALGGLAATGLAAPTAGSLDTTFGTAGTTIAAVPGVQAFVSGAGADPQGRILVGGLAITGSGASFSPLGARFTAQGALDPTYGTGGTVVVPGPELSVNAATVAPDGSLLVGGTARTGSSGLLTRITTAGAPDPTFGGGGTISLPQGVGAIAVQPNLSVLVSGGGKVTRLTPSGTPDPTFGVGGTSAATGVGGSALAVDPQGRILVAGSSTSGGGYWMAVTRLLPSGAVDPAFGGGKPVLVQPGCGQGAGPAVRQILVQPNGAIVLAGNTAIGNIESDGSSPAYGYIGLARFTGSGARDGSFGRSGVVLLRFGTMAGQPSGVAADGAVLLPTGQVVVSGPQGIVRTTPAGVLDTTFGQGGIAPSSFAGLSPFDQPPFLPVFQPSTGRLVLASQQEAYGGAGEPDPSSLALAGMLMSPPGASPALNATPPGAPRSVKASTVKKSGKWYIKLTWTKPSSAGGTPVRGYVPSFRVSGKGAYVPACAQGTSWQSPAVKAGTTYQLRIQAANDLALGSSASVVSIKVPTS